MKNISLAILVAVVFAAFGHKEIYSQQKREVKITTIKKDTINDKKNIIMDIPVVSGKIEDERIFVSSNGELISFKRDGKYGYANSKGEEIIPPKYDYIWSFQEALLGFKRRENWDLSMRMEKK